MGHIKEPNGVTLLVDKQDLTTEIEDKIKAWHLHKKMTLNYVAVFGSIKIVLYDDRKESKTKGEIQEIYLSNFE